TPTSGYRWGPEDGTATVDPATSTRRVCCAWTLRRCGEREPPSIGPASTRCWPAWRTSTSGTTDLTEVGGEKMMPPPQSGAGSGEAGAPRETIAPCDRSGTSARWSYFTSATGVKDL